MKRALWPLMAALAAAAPMSAVADARERADEHHEQATAFYRVEAYEEAIEEWKESYELHPNPSRLFNIGRAYEELGEYQDAVEYYRRYMSDDPDGDAVSEARARSVRLERELEREREAEALSTARQRVSERDYEGAIEAYQRAYELSEDPALVYEIAQARRLAGDREEAIAEYERYLELAPDGEHATEAVAHQEDLEAELAEAPEEAPEEEPEEAPAEAPAAEPSGGWSGMRIAGTGALGAGAIGVGLGVVFGTQARSAQSAIEGEEVAWSGDLDDEIDRGEAAERNMIIATSIGGAALAAGAALFYLDMQRDPSPASSVSVAPSFGGSQTGFVIQGRF